jgi:glycoside/pentoside/hexuronide:cation symporter, GPH family
MDNQTKVAPNHADNELGFKRLSLPAILNYSVGALGFMLLLNAVGSYLTYFYTDVVGIGAAVVGTVLLITRITDAITDPLMGVIADKTYSKKHGLYRPFIIWGAIPLVVIGTLVFYVPDFLTSNASIVIYAFLTYFIFNIFYTITYVPFFAISPTLAMDPNDRNTMLGIKKIFVKVGTVIAASFTLPLVNLFSNQAIGFPIVMGAFGVLFLITMLFVTISTRKYKRFLIPSEDTEKSLSTIKILKTLRKNDQLLLISLAFGLESIVITLVNQSGIYYMTYVVGNQNLVALFNGIIGVTAILCVFLIPTLAKRIEKKTFFILGFAIAFVGSVALFFVPPTNIPLLMITRVITGIGIGTGGLLIFSMVADCVDYGNWKTGIRASGLTFSFTTFLQKFGIAIGAALSGYILSMVNYVPNVEQSPLSQNGIIWMNSLVPAIVFLIGIFIILPYNLTKAKTKKIQEELSNM